MTALGTVIGRGLLAARPAAGIAGTLYYATDDSTLWRDNGASWDSVGSNGIIDPMTTRGDLIARNATVPARLPVGAAGTVLGSDGTDPSWGNGPLTTQDDIIVGGASGALTRLAKGADSQVLTVDPVTHHLAWDTPAVATLAPATMPEIASPAAPSAGNAYLYAKADGRIYSKDPGGVEYGPFDVAGGGSAVPTLAYVVGATWAANSDKFQGPALGGQWTQVGTPTLTFPAPDAGYPTVAAGKCLDLGALAVSTGIYQAVPATPWKAVLGFSFKHLSSGGFMFGLFASSSTTQRGMGYYTDGNLYAPLGAGSYSYDGTHTSQNSSFGGYPLPQGYPGDGATASRAGAILFRLGSTDNAAIKMEASVDGGANWIVVNASYATGITITRIFIGSIFGTASAHPQLLFFNWE